MDYHDREGVPLETCIKVSGNATTLFHSPEDLDCDSPQHLFTLHLYNTTNHIMLHGKFIKKWEDHEYPHLRLVYDKGKEEGQVLTAFNQTFSVNLILTEEFDIEPETELQDTGEDTQNNIPTSIVNNLITPDGSGTNTLRRRKMQTESKTKKSSN